MSPRLWIIWIWSLVQSKWTICDVGPSMCTNQGFVGVSKPWEFRFGSDIHQSDNRVYIMTGKAYQVTCCGYVTGWEFQASLRAQIRKITFLTWRPYQPSSAILTLTGLHHVWYMKERSQTVTVKLDIHEYIFVKQGDIIGWHAPSGDVIDYKTTNDVSSSYIIAQNMSNLATGMNYTHNGQQHRGRIYGIKAILTPAQPQRFINLSNKITLKCPLEINHYVTTLEVSDASTVKYNIDGYNPWFSVDEITGEVRTISRLNGNLTSDITIVVTSTCDVQATMVLSVQCIDLTERMQERQSEAQKASGTISQTSRIISQPVYHVTFLESLTTETTLRVFNVTKEYSEKVICIMVNTQPAVPLNVLYTSGDSLLVRSQYDLLFNTTQTIFVNVTCIRGDGYAVQEELTAIHILKDLEPVFENLPALITVSARRVYVGDTVFQVTAVDKESPILTFGSGNCSCPFLVNIDGSVFVSNDLRKTTQASFLIEVFVNDGFQNSGPQLLSIVLGDLNHPPHFINLCHEVVIPENKDGVIMTIHAYDQDTQDNITITWAWENEAALKYFIFNESTNQLSLNPSTNLNYDLLMTTRNHTSFALLVSVSDGVLSSDTEKIMVYVTKVNKAPVEAVKKLSVTSSEGKAGDCISAVDLRNIFADPDYDMLTFSLLQDNGTDWLTFTIDSYSGWMNLTHDVDVTRETSPLVLLVNIKAEDPEKLSAMIEIEVRLHFVSTKPILLGLPAQATMFENMLVTEVVHTVAFADEDGDNITLIYNSADDTKNGVVVFINETSGEVRIISCPALSQGQNVHISVNIKAFDGQETSEPGLLSITVVGVNDPPRFPRHEYLFTINETQVGSYIATQDIWANLDLDPGDKLIFFITGDNMGEDTVFVNSLTGEIRVVDEYDIDKEGNGCNLTVLLMVIDAHGLNSTTKVTIKVTDINDNKPIVENDGETFVIFSDITPGWRIGQIKASDIDSGKNSALTFSLTGSSLNDTSGYFINSRDGSIFFTRIQAPENYITLYVSVSDNGWPPNTASAAVHVMITKFTNETIAHSPLLQQSTSTDENRRVAVFVLTAVVTCCIAVIAALSYHLWKTRKILRITQPEQGHDAYHEYRFQWVPRHIAEDGQEADVRTLRSSLHAIPSFSRTSVSNQNFQYEPAALSPSQEILEQCSQSDHVKTAQIDN